MLARAHDDPREGAPHEIARHLRRGQACRAARPTWRRRLPDPLAHVVLEPDPVHEVVDGLAQAAAEALVVAARGIVEGELVAREGDLRFRPKADAVEVGILPDGAVRRRGEAVPERRLEAARFEELAHALERV